MEIKLCDVTKIFPYTRVRGLLGRKKQRALLQKQHAMPYTTNEGVVVLQHVELTIADGEFLVILGPSGCGKTTLLRLLAGLEDPSLGEILFDGVCVNDLPPEDRDVAMVFQNYNLYPHLTVFDNVAFTLRNLHLPREQIQEQVEQMAELLGISECLQRLPSQLSGGQLQRVALARALVRKPKLFLLDEPFSNLDPQLRGSLRLLVKKLHAALGTTFVFVTHDQQEALLLGSRILVLKDGCMVQEGTPAQLYNRPNCVHAALALGTPPMNLLSLSGDGTVLGHRVTVAGCAMVGIRPVHLELSADGFPVTVDYAEPLGSETVLHLRAQGQTLTLLTRDNRSYHRGEPLCVTADSGRFHFFDADGNRL